MPLISEQRLSHWFHISSISEEMASLLKSAAFVIQGHRSAAALRLLCARHRGYCKNTVVLLSSKCYFQKQPPFILSRLHIHPRLCDWFAVSSSLCKHAFDEI